jgi:hypothetical protein
MDSCSELTAATRRKSKEGAERLRTVDALVDGCEPVSETQSKIILRRLLWTAASDSE